MYQCHLVFCFLQRRFVHSFNNLVPWLSTGRTRIKIKDVYPPKVHTRRLMFSRLVHAFTCAGMLPAQYLKFGQLSKIGCAGKWYIRRSECKLIPSPSCVVCCYITQKDKAWERGYTCVFMFMHAHALQCTHLITIRIVSGSVLNCQCRQLWMVPRVLQTTSPKERYIQYILASACRRVTLYSYCTWILFVSGSWQMPGMILLPMHFTLLLFAYLAGMLISNCLNSLFAWVKNVVTWNCMFRSCLTMCA